MFNNTQLLLIGILVAVITTILLQPSPISVLMALLVIVLIKDNGSKNND